CKRLRAAGYQILSDDRLFSVHLGDPPTLRAVFNGELWRGRSNLAVSLRGPITPRELPSIVVPIVQLTGIVLAVLAIAFAGRAAVRKKRFCSAPRNPTGRGTP